MKLPNALSAVVEREKVVDYLLNRAHRCGASKAEFFFKYGFRLDQWEVLAQALLEHGQRHDVINVTETGFGPRYLIDGELPWPDGRAPPRPDSLATGAEHRPRRRFSPSRCGKSSRTESTVTGLKMTPQTAIKNAIPLPSSAAKSVFVCSIQASPLNRMADIN
jgi:hypothetical protein